MVYFNVSSKLEDKVELRAVDQDEIVEARVDWRYDANESGALRARTHQYLWSNSNKCVKELTCWHCGTRSLVLGWRLSRCSNRIRNQWLQPLLTSSLPGSAFQMGLHERLTITRTSRRY
jgi:hypothetical protein